MTKTNKTDSKMEEIKKEFEDVMIEIWQDIKNQKYELIELGECDGTCECEIGYEKGQTYRCQHCEEIVVDDDKIWSFILSKLQEVRQEERNRIRKLIENKLDEGQNVYLNEAIHDILSLLEEEK